MIPNLWDDYARFCQVRQTALNEEVLDLGDFSWVYPTVLLPIVGHVMDNPDVNLGYRPPQDIGVEQYVSLMLSNPTKLSSHDKTYIPNFILPHDPTKVSPVISRIYSLSDQGREYGGQNAFKHLIGELVDNIYEHSRFINAMLMAQRYEKKGFVEISFYDDGITIGRSLRAAGHERLVDHEAIRGAVSRGLSSKSDAERGYGLSTNVKMLTDASRGLKGKVLIVSGKGAVGYSHEPSGRYVYNLEDNYYRLDGTLVSVRIPYPAKEVNLYDFTE